MHAKRQIDAEVKRDARVAGLRDFETPSLEAVEQRRRQLWRRTASGLAAVAFLIVLLSAIPTEQARWLGTGRAQVVVMIVAGVFFVWAFEKESALGRLTRTLTESGCSRPRSPTACTRCRCCWTPASR